MNIIWAKKTAAFGLTLALAASAFAGCGSASSGSTEAAGGTGNTEAETSVSGSETANTSEPDGSLEGKEADADTGDTVLRVGAQTYPLYSSVNLAYDLGYIDEELGKVGASVEWTNYDSGPLVNEAVAAGEEDVGFMADLPAILARSSGQDIQAVANIATGEKSLAILVPEGSDITEISQLKGKKIAYASGSYAQHLLALVLDKAGLTFQDIESVNLGAADQETALTSGQVDAIVIWEQYITKLTDEGKARVLIDGTGLKKSNMILYSKTDYAEENSEVIEAFIRAVDRGANYIQQSPDKAAEILAKDYNVTEDQMKQILKNFEFSVTLDEDDIEEIGKVADYAYQAKIIPEKVNIDDFINTEYLKEAGF